MEKLELLNILERNGLTIVGLVPDPIVSGRFTAFVEVVRDGNNRQVPPNQKLKEAANLVAQQGGDIAFVLLDLINRDVEQGARATVLHAFSDYARNVFLSSEGNVPTIWIEAKRSLPLQVEKDLRMKMLQYMEVWGYKDVIVAIVGQSNAPTRLAILKQVRLKAPVDQGNLKAELTKNKFDVPTDSWLAHQLDALRKAGLVIRLKNEKFVLTLNALKQLGSSKNRNSPDILRLLEVSRRKS
ncbi:MAG: hypothetical protein ABIN69_13780 [Aestuariivirga sp.]